MLATAWAAVKDDATTDRTLRSLAGAFAAAGYRLYLVGGSVRDALLGRLSHDLDFTTDARPEAVSAILDDIAETVWDTGIDFGTVSAMYQGSIVEITTFRADTYDGASRNPEVTYGDTLEGDLVRRDFRCNALALELSEQGEHELRDPLNGLDDIVDRVLDTPAAPEQSFHDDPLRMLRACRFASQLGFDVQPRVREAMVDMSSQIQRITVERVAAELNKLMLGAEPWTGLDLMVDTGLADHVLPELPALKLTQDEHRQHKDVYAHS
ncbi:MAG: CCA tRNA nucleotidyltransferase, partial [Corynebacterium sp.]|nr:CCA tRNA nucleotidyltransferase [Corynebacterium sp.]